MNELNNDRIYVKPVLYEGEEYISVRAFASIVGKFTNQVYTLATNGNQFRKLRSTMIDNQLYILKSEIYDYPFNPVRKVEIDLRQMIQANTNILQSVLNKIAAIESSMLNIVTHMNSRIEDLEEITKTIENHFMEN